jgi:hypothetical protein
LGGSRKLGGGLVALLGLFCHAAGDDLIESGRDGGVEGAGSRRIRGQVGSDLLFHAVAGERLCAR